MTRPGSAPSRARTFLHAGEFAASVDAFGAVLTARGHTALVVDDYTRSARHFGHWLRLRGIAPCSVGDETLSRFAAHRCSCPGGRGCRRLSPRYAGRVRCFVAFLRERGETPRDDVRTGDALPADLVAFRDHLLGERGVVPATADKHVRLVLRLLPVLGNDPARYDARSVRDVALTAVSTTSRADAKTIVTALRVWLRFLASRGACLAGLEEAIPRVPQWRLSALPRYLPPGEVERVIGSCDLRTVHGLRDRAILLLLARLGLRAGDVLLLRFDDLDWTAATLRVRGKGRRDVHLPLPQDVGDALLAYLAVRRDDGGGGGGAEPRVFLRAGAPRRPFADSTAISSVVRLALERADIANPPTRGANLLRHSAATSLLRAGATLDAVSALLRHRSLDTTAHYAKVDVPMLRRIARPWPEGAPC
ncbi:tyrosine-type recombinase/integrase [Roseomonas chloroacetimidivorans]|uniref:tyrosine-type recombinase/integrase n=1 Tax=Roseomonas chloroacetimidivorans TaxID=1766656 RepID=UPI003C7282AB